MAAETFVLHHFLHSHFNEKARWALDYKRVNHEREFVLPGPHAVKMRRLSGQRSTPVLQTLDGVVAGSGPIIDFLEKNYPDPPLYPNDPALRQAALAWQARCDLELGPATRSIVFEVLLDELPFMASMFARDAHRWVRAGYAKILPAARGNIVKLNKTKPEQVARAHETVERILDEIAQEVQGTGFLVGDSFSVADLTAAALLTPVIDVPHEDLQRPEPVPKRILEILAKYQDHSATQWAQNMFANFR